MSEDDSAPPVPTASVDPYSLPASAPRTGPSEDVLKIRNAVVKVFTTRKRPMWFYPFQNDYQRNSISSGFFIELDRKRYIMCNAHGIAHGTSIRVRKNGDDTKYLAKVAHVTHEGDLALLTVEKKAAKFWKGTTPLKFYNLLPELQAEVIVLGYPSGGDSLSITKGVVSRINLQNYTHSSCLLPTVQTDAAINGGNSGGPAVLDGKVIGIAFQGRRKSQNIGYVIPFCVVNFFLSSIVDHGKFCGFGSLGVSDQPLENESLRKYHKMGERTGIRVQKVAKLRDCFQKLKVDDVLLSLDGMKLGNDGRVTIRDSERVRFKWLVRMKRPGTMAKFRILRNAKEMDVEVEIFPSWNNEIFVPRHLHDQKPSYFVHGGLVLTRLSWPLLKATYGSDLSKNNMAASIRVAAYKLYRDRANEEIVVLTQILDNPLNINYKQKQSLERVEKINGVEVLNMKHALDLMLSTEHEFFRVDFEHMGSVILEQKGSFAANSKIKEDHRMFSMWSDDLKEHFEANLKEKLKSLLAGDSLCNFKLVEAPAASEALGYGDLDIPRKASLDGNADPPAFKKQKLEDGMEL